MKKSTFDEKKSFFKNYWVIGGLLGSIIVIVIGLLGFFDIGPALLLCVCVTVTIHSI